MKIVYTESFTSRLEKQLLYIAKDNPSAATRLKIDILRKIKEIPDNPYRYRKSKYFENESIRELIFKGYTIVFHLHLVEKRIEVFGFVKFQEVP